MSDHKSVGDHIRAVLIDFKHDRIKLGDAMRMMKVIIKNTNNEFFYRGKMRKAIEYKMIGKDKDDD